MRKVISALAILFCLSAEAQQTNTIAVQWSPVDFIQFAPVSSQVQIQPLWTYNVFGSNIVTGAARAFSTGTKVTATGSTVSGIPGSLIISNVIPGVYKVTFYSGSTSTATITNVFTNGTPAFVNAKDYVAVSTNSVNGFGYAYTIAQVNALLSTNPVVLPSTLTNNTTGNSAATTNAFPGGNIITTNFSGLTYYVAPWPTGNDTNNNGLSQFTPFQSIQMAEFLATFGDTIHLMDGTNVVRSPLLSGAGVTNFCVELPNGVNWFSEPNSWLVITNYGSPGSSSRAFFCCTVGNNTINNLNFLVPDVTNSQTVIGYGQIDSPVGHTNIVFNNLNLISYGTGIRLESAVTGTSNLCQMSFNNPHILANANCITLKDWNNPRITVTGGEMTTVNFVANGVINGKPLRAVAIEAQSATLGTNALVCNGTIFHLSDTDLSNSNRPAYVVWENGGLLQSNLATFNGCSVDWLARTNPGSLDFSTNFAGSLNIPGGMPRTDGQTNTYPVGNAPNFGVFPGTMAAANLTGSGTLPITTLPPAVFTNGSATAFSNLNSFRANSFASIGTAPTITVNSTLTGLQVTNDTSANTMSQAVTITNGTLVALGTVMWTNTYPSPFPTGHLPHILGPFETGGTNLAVGTWPHPYTVTESNYLVIVGTTAFPITTNTQFTFVTMP